MLDYVVGAAHVPALLDHLTDGALLITPGDRADLLVAASAAHAAGNVTLAGLVLTLGEFPDRRAVRVIERLNTGLAMLVVRGRQLPHDRGGRPDRGPAEHRHARARSRPRWARSRKAWTPPS